MRPAYNAVTIIPFIPEMATACHDILRALPDWFGVPVANESFIQSLAKLPTLVACGDTVVGFIAIDQHFPEAAECHVLAIHPQYHRLGIGRRLISEVEQGLRGRGVRVFSVKTLGPSHPDSFYAQTRAFYRAIGFIPLLETNAFWGADNPTLIMVKHL